MNLLSLKNQRTILVVSPLALWKKGRRNLLLQCLVVLSSRQYSKYQQWKIKMGNHYSIPTRDWDNLLHDLPGITLETTLGKARFLKTLKVIHDEGTAVCKIYIKPTANTQLDKFTRKLTEIRENVMKFVKNPNAMPFTRFFETEKAGYVLRQYFSNNLYDRISTRPFLTTIEKQWITFQLLKALERCHFCGICHGDLKSENVMVTSWNWVFITDFALYKPTFLPEDNPADFSYFFDSSGRRICYIAPERFFGALSTATPTSPTPTPSAQTPSPSISGGASGAAGVAPGGHTFAQSTSSSSSFASFAEAQFSDLETSMDIFSLGCVIAELWLEGTALFNLAELLSYRKVDDPNRFDPNTKLNKIENPAVRKMILHMIQLNPADRLSAAKYAQLYTPELFPSYFTELHAYIATLNDLEPDDRVRILAHDFELMLSKFVGSGSSQALARPNLLSAAAAATDEMITRLEHEAAKTAQVKGGDKEDSFASGPITDSEQFAFISSIQSSLLETEEFLGDLESLNSSSQSLNSSQPNDQSLLEVMFPIPGDATSDTSPLSVDQLRHAAERFRELKQSAKQKDDKLGLIKAFDTLAAIARCLNDNAKALAYHAKYLSVARVIDLKSAIQKGLYHQGVTYQQMEGSLPKAIADFEHSLELARSLEDRIAQAKLCQRLGDVYHLTKNFEKALRFQQEFLQLSKEVGVKPTSLASAPASQSIASSISFHAISSNTTYTSDAQLGSQHGPVNTSNGFVIITSILCAMLRNLREPQAKLLCLNSFIRISPYVDDEIRLQRMIPYITSLLDADTRDPSALVCAQAIKSLAFVLSSIKTFPPSDASLFPDYILPVLNFILSTDGEESDELILQAYAESLPRLAETARRFLETAQFFKQKDQKDSTTSSSDNVSRISHTNFQREIDELRNAFKDVVNLMLRADSPAVLKKAIISEISTLCVFFGQEQTNDVLLPLIFTCLNSRDWELKCIVFENIVGVSTVSGAEGIESWILTCIPPQIHDEEEAVVAGAVNSLAALCDLGIVRKQILFDLVDKIVPLLLHPNTWIRYGAASVVLSAAKKLPLADVRCFLIPKLRRFLVRDIAEITKSSLLQSLVAPVSRRSFEKALAVNFDAPVVSTTLPALTSTPESSTSLTVSGTSGSSDSKDSHAPKEELSDFVKPPPSLDIDTIDPIPGLTLSLQDKDKEVDLPFSLAIGEADLPAEDEKKLFAMKEYIKIASTKRRTRVPNIDRSFYEEFKDITAGRVPVYELPLASLANMQGYLDFDVAEQNEEWKDFFGSNSAAGFAFDKDRDTLATMDQQSGTGSFTSSPGSVSGGPARRNSVAPAPAAKRSPAVPSPTPGQPKGSPTQASGKPTDSAANILSAQLHPSLPPNVILSTLPQPRPDLGGLFQRPYTGASFKGWKPQGVLVAHLHEHTAPVNEIQVSKDNVFFATASDDGTVKIWDCLRLEKNVTNRSRLTYSTQGGKILSLAIAENSHSFVAGSSNGSIHVVRVDVARVDPAQKKPNHDYTGLATVRQVDKTEGAVVSVKHVENFETAQSMIVYATDGGIIHAWDMRSQREAWTMQNRPHLGLITSMMIDPSRHWMAVATNRGYVTCWDVRFKVCFKEWRLPDKSLVHQLTTPFWSQVDTPSLLIAGGPGDLAEWNLDTATCSRVLRILPTGGIPGRLSFSPTHSDVPLVMDDQLGLSDFQRQTSNSSQITSFCLPLSTPNAQYKDSQFIITAGTDKKIRYWDLQSPKNSSVISGLSTPEAKPTYTDYKSPEGVDIIDETPADPNDRLNVVPDGNLRETILEGPTLGHRDTILDLKLIEAPSRMIISGSRDGVIKVWK